MLQLLLFLKNNSKLYLHGINVISVVVAIFAPMYNIR